MRKIQAGFVGHIRPDKPILFQDSLYQDIAKANKDGLDSVGKYLSTENFDNMTKGELEQFQGLTND